MYMLHTYYIFILCTYILYGYMLSCDPVTNHDNPSGMFFFFFRGKTIKTMTSQQTWGFIPNTCGKLMQTQDLLHKHRH